MSVRTKQALCLAIVGIVVNLCLALVKLFVGLRSNSLCILLDSTNGFFDTMTAIITAIAFGLTALKPTEKFPYGFGRGEYLAGFIVAVVAGIMGVKFLFDSLERMAMPEPVWFGLQSCILIGASVLVKLALAVTFGLVNKKLRSKAIRAIAIDSYLDVGITGATVISFTVSANVSYAVDAIVGIVISIVVIVVAIFMIIDNLRILLGTNEFSEERDALIAICKKIDCVEEIKSIRLHDYGYRAKYGTFTLAYKKESSSDEIKQANEAILSYMENEKGVHANIVRFE